MLGKACSLAFGAFLALQLASCASDDVRVSTTYDPLTPFPASATWSWDESEISKPSDPRLADLDADKLIRDAVESEFAARSYAMTSSSSAVYHLSYNLSIHTWVGPNASSAFGTIALEMEDAQTGHRVWVGFARAEIHVGLSAQERRERLRRVLAKMLENFPPSQRGS